MPTETTETPAGDDAPKKKKKWFSKNDTVRQRKKQKVQTIQNYMKISQIRNDTIILKNGGLRAVIEIEALNFNLKSETEQKAIIAGYESFVNTLTFPVQIVVRSTKMNIDPYLLNLRNRAEEHTNDLLKEQTLDYANFIEKIVDVADIMQKRFYIVVPLDESVKQSNTLGQFFGWMKVDETLGKVQRALSGFSEKTTRLRERVSLVESGLSNVGLKVKRLSTDELIKLYYRVYNPSTAQQQKLPEHLNTHDGVL